jgi:hypothetical protein
VLRFGALGAAGSTFSVLQRAARLPIRLSGEAVPALPDVQHDIGAFLAPVETLDGVAFRFGPVFTKFVTADLLRVPTRDDQRILADALDTLEGTYPFAPSGAFTFVSYGLAYFRMLPRGLGAAYVPRLIDQPTRFALEEAVPAPTDVSFRYGTATKQRFNVPVRIEGHALLFTIRGDSLPVVSDVEAWLGGSNVLAGRRVLSPPLRTLLRFDLARVMFNQRGMPRRVADRAGLMFANRIHPESPMWMGFADQQTAGSGPAAITTFQGNASARLTAARSGDYFDNASIQHLSHVILDLEQFYLGDSAASRARGSRSYPGRFGGRSSGYNEADQDDDLDTASSAETENTETENDETFLERVQYMFRSTPPPALGFADQITDGGGPTFLPNEFRGPDDAARGAQGIGTPAGEHRLGHVSALQRSSRAQDGTPIHIRMDGPGYDSLDVPDGSNQAKLQFSIFVPTAEFFARMRTNQASADLARTHAVPQDDQGIERFLTTTRRQNFLVPPRRHRAFPLIELADERHFI